MSDIKLFQIRNNQVSELHGKSVEVEKSLQTLLENHLEEFLGVTFLVSEYSTGAKHKGRIDSLGIDENNCPVIIEYKRSTNENVVNQGLYYLDWLLDHKAEFQLLVQEKISKETAKKIEWGSARLICIAGDYTKFDSYAVEQINRNIELYRYKHFGDILLLELINSVTGATDETPKKKIKSSKQYKSVSEFLAQASTDLKDMYESLKSYIMNLGDDIQFKELALYFAFKRIKTFVSVEIHPKTNMIVLYVRLDPNKIKLEEGFTRDVTNIGHWGVGNLEIRISSADDFEKAKSLIHKSYELA